MAQHLAPLRGQRGQLARDRVVSRHAHPPHLLGFLSRRRPPQGRQAQGHANRILRLSHPVALGHPEERCNRLGADRQADMIKSYSRSSCELVLQLGLKRQAHWGRGHLREQRLTLGQRVMREPLGLEHLLARTQALGIGAEALDEVLARR